jgi:hypothetical protein
LRSSNGTVDTGGIKVSLMVLLPRPDSAAFGLIKNCKHRRRSIASLQERNDDSSCSSPGHS